MGLEQLAEAKLRPLDVVNQRTDDSRERIIALSMELTKRALQSSSLDDIYFLLTNDIRTLISFDRSLLISHLGGESRFVAAGNQPIVEKKSEIYAAVKALGTNLKDLTRPLLFRTAQDLENIPDEQVNRRVKDALNEYLQVSSNSATFCIPISIGNEVVAHLVLEYFDAAIPDNTSISAFIGMMPAFATALVKEWLIQLNPDAVPVTQHRSWRHLPQLRKIYKHRVAVVSLMLLGVMLLFIIPFSFNVGGESEIVPKKRHMAFADIDGLIDKILVSEGSHVEKGQILAHLDSTELDYKLKTAQNQAQLLATEVSLLKKMGSQDSAKLAESQLSELKHKNLLLEIAFLDWQRQFLNIKAPVSGVIVTKHIETLIGKKLKTGEVFAEIAVPSELQAEILVPEDRILSVSVDQSAEIYLNNDPMMPYALKVSEIAPRADVVTRLGNVYRVKATFQNANNPLRAGMKGIGKIQTGTKSLFSIIAQRVKVRINQALLKL